MHITSASKLAYSQVLLKVTQLTQLVHQTIGILSQLVCKLNSKISLELLVKERVLRHPFFLVRVSCMRTYAEHATHVWLLMLPVKLDVLGGARTYPYSFTVRLASKMTDQIRK